MGVELTKHRFRYSSLIQYYLKNQASRRFTYLVGKAPGFKCALRLFEGIKENLPTTQKQSTAIIGLKFRIP